MALVQYPFVLGVMRDAGFSTSRSSPWRYSFQFFVIYFNLFMICYIRSMISPLFSFLARILNPCFVAEMNIAGKSQSGMVGDAPSNNKKATPFPCAY